ncbi:MAG: nucleotide exchange factor GrpE [Coriobacteriales bacterium]|jgi:molecular chaperone GrpE|nr:nucleotide exchange factor GrpE [Coriobacteriales bacterium]
MAPTNEQGTPKEALDADNVRDQEPAAPETGELGGQLGLELGLEQELEELEGLAGQLEQERESGEVASEEAVSGEPFDGQPDELAQALAEADELRDRYVRLQAEWDNFRKRTAAERAEERVRAAERLVERLLPIVDDLERAIEHSDTANEASLKEGIAAVYSKLSEVLGREGVKTIDPVGAVFDANLHQAVGKVDDDSVPDETVTQVYQKGYEMGARVLRPAMVVVSQGGPKQPVES